MTQQALYYNSNSRLACDCVLPAQVILCVPQSIIAPREDTPDFQYRYIDASVTARSVLSDACTSSYNRYTISYDDTQLIGQIPLRADQIQGIVCRGCLTTFIEDTAGNDVSIVDNGDGTQSLHSQHGEIYPLVVTAQNLLACEYVASQYGGVTQAALVAAVAAIGGSQATLFIDCGAWAINANQTFPANINVKILQGAVLTVAPAITLQFDGAFDAPVSKVFDGTGSVVFSDKTIVSANALWFGTDFTAIQKALSSSRSVVVPKGIYSGTTELQVLNDGQELILQEATLNAGANNMTILRWSAADGVMRGAGTISGTGFTTTRGLVIAPVNEAGVILRTVLDRNVFSDLIIKNCTDALTLKEGPTVLGVPSTTQFNVFKGIAITSCNRAIVIADGPNLGAVGCNSNSFFGIQLSGGSNTGIIITNGSSNSFVACNLSNVSSGVSPLLVPTAIYITATNAFAVPNSNNSFIGVTCFLNTSDMVNLSPTTSVVASNLTTGSFLNNQRLLQGGDIAQIPFTLDDAILIQDAALLPGVDVGITVNRNTIITNGFECYDQSYAWQNYTLVLGNLTNASGIANVRSKFIAFARFVRWYFQFTFTPVNANNPVDIDFPAALPFNAAFYLGLPNSMTLVGNVRTIAGGGPYIVANYTVPMEFIVGNKLRVYPPVPGWLLGSSGGITAEIEYRL